MIKADVEKFFISALMSFFAVFSITYFVIEGIYKDGVYILFIVAFFCCFTQIKLDSKFIFLMAVPFFILLAPDIINIIRGYTRLSDIEKVSRNLLVILPAALVLYKEIDSRVIIKFISVILGFTLFFCILQKNGLFAVESHKSSSVNPGLWFNKGSFSSAIVFFYSIFLGGFLVKERSIGFIWFGISFLSCASILYMTEARGPLLAFLLVNSILMAVLLRRHANNKNIMIPAILVLFMIFFIVYSMWDRIYLAYVNIQNYFMYDQAYNSVGIRIDSWLMAWDVFLKAPWFGLGVEGAYASKQEIVSAGEYPAYMLKYHTHSEYFTILERGGMFGVFCFFMFVVFPFYMLYSYKVSLSGMLPTVMVFVSLLVIGITSATLRNNIGANSFLYCLVMAQVISILAVREGKQNEKSY